MATQAPGLSAPEPNSPKVNWRLVFVKAAGATAGAVLGLSLVLGAIIWYSSLPPSASQWKTIPFDNVSYLTNAIFNDLGVPNIKVTAKAKFLPQLGGGSSYQIGYVVDVSMDALDLAKVPDKYKKATNEVINGHEFTTDPLTTATYKAHLTFYLKDADGFQLATIEGKDHYIHSGETDALQDTADGLISPQLLKRTKQISGHLEVITCESCK